MKTSAFTQISASIVLLTAFVGAYTATAQNTRTGIFNPDYRTLTIEIDGARLAPAILGLNSSDKLTIGFDHLSDEREYLRYSIYHCDANWQLSNLIDNEVFSGFNFADITDYEFSRATTTHYVHYSISLPNDDFQFSLSGNYLLKVYPENEPDETLLQARFMVSEGAVAILGDVTSRTDVGFNSTMQQLELNVNTAHFAIRDPYNDLKLVISQNSRLDNTVLINHPSRVAGSTSYYEHLPQLIFPAGNEYRRIETTQQTYPGMGVADIEYHAPYYHHFITPNSPRYAQSYLFDSTQHGRFFVREYNATDPNVEADYAVVHFILDMLPIPDMDVYIDGDLVNRRFDDSSRMIYDEENGYYRKALLLKQGAYNYQYLAIPSTPTAVKPRHDANVAQQSNPYFANGTTWVGSTDAIEGNFYQTVNEYLAAIYYRVPGERYDRLLGYSLLFSGR
jgi:hypothetical protein